MSSEHAPFRIRRMTLDDVELALQWAGSEGWNPGKHDAACFYGADPQGFFIGELEGEPVGAISAVAYGGTFGFIGLFIVRPEHRGGTFGVRLAQEAMAHLGARNVGLDGVLAKQRNYEAAGFQFAYRNARYEGVGEVGAPGDVVALSTIPFDVVADYDARYFPARREEFLRLWLAQPEAASYAVCDGGELRGYGLIRPCQTGFKIGPLFAEGEAEAETLFQALSSHAAGAPVFLDVPEPNALAVRLAQRHAMRPMFYTARMYSLAVPELPIEGIYGVTTFELG